MSSQEILEIFEVAEVHELAQPSLVHQDPNTFSKASLEPPTEIGEIREELDGYFVSRMQFVDLNSFPSNLRTKEQRWIFHGFPLHFNGRLSRLCF